VRFSTPLLYPEFAGPSSQKSSEFFGESCIFFTAEVTKLLTEMNGSLLRAKAFGAGLRRCQAMPGMNSVDSVDSV
jgi:hypothetical protein